MITNKEKNKNKSNNSKKAKKHTAPLSTPPSRVITPDEEDSSWWLENWA